MYVSKPSYTEMVKLLTPPPKKWRTSIKESLCVQILSRHGPIKYRIQSSSLSIVDALQSLARLPQTHPGKVPECVCDLTGLFCYFVILYPFNRSLRNAMHFRMMLSSSEEQP